MMKRIAIVLTTILLTFTMVDTLVVDAASKSVKDNEKQVDKLKEKKDEIDKKNELTKKEIDELILEIDMLNDDKKDIEREIEKNERQMEKVNDEIKLVKEEIDELQKSIDARADIVANRLMAIQTKGEPTYLDVIFGSSSFIDFISRARVVSTIIEADNDIMNNFFTDVDTVNKKLDEVEDLKKDVQSVKKGNEDKKEELENNIKKTKKQKKELDEEIKSSERSLEEIKKEQDELIEKINKELGMKTGLGEGKLEWPTVSATYISSGIGQRTHPKTGKKGTFHKGIDIARNDKSVTPPVYAAEEGVVLEARRAGGYGNMIKIEHENGVETLYGHLSELRVEPGDKVRRGQTIGIMGTTGMSTGVHLHFEVYEDGKLQNPLRYVR